MFPKTDKCNYLLAYLITFANKCPKLINHRAVWSGKPWLCCRLRVMRKGRCSLCDVPILGVSVKGSVEGKQILA